MEQLIDFQGLLDELSRSNLNATESYAVLALCRMGHASIRELSEYTKISIPQMRRVVYRLTELGVYQNEQPRGTGTKIYSVSPMILVSSVAGANLTQNDQPHSLYTMYSNISKSSNKERLDHFDKPSGDGDMGKEEIEKLMQVQAEKTEEVRKEVDGKREERKMRQMEMGTGEKKLNGNNGSDKEPTAKDLAKQFRSMYLRYVGKAFPGKNIEVQELSGWKRVITRYGYEEVELTVRYVLKDWQSVFGRFNIHSNPRPSYFHSSNLMDSWVAEAQDGKAPEIVSKWDQIRQKERTKGDSPGYMEKNRDKAPRIGMDAFIGNDGGKSEDGDGKD